MPAHISCSLTIQVLAKVRGYNNLLSSVFSITKLAPASNKQLWSVSS